ncbi:phosphatidic acid phosphatase type 2/haloperoxidase [Zopfochytrium polystomum]|nr:phosphatidic acid phosphatase type 2/haloperoxidase [Zopfochytrium polystomum]
MATPPTTPTSLKPFSFTFVQYDPADLLGKPLAIASLLPQILIVVYLTLALSRRDILVASTALGQLLNEVLNLIVKNTIRQPRPTSFLGKGYGMPSSHAQFMAFWAVNIALHFWIRVRPQPRLYKVLITLVVATAAVVVGYSRVHLYYHTASQVVTGIHLGTLCGTLWFLVTERVLLPAVTASRVVERSALLRWLRVRDTSRVGDLVRVEYEAVVRAAADADVGGVGGDGADDAVEGRRRKVK